MRFGKLNKCVVVAVVATLTLSVCSALIEDDHEDNGSAGDDLPNVTTSQSAQNISDSESKLDPTVRQRTFTVCYGILFERFDNYSSLLQSVAFNRLMGAEHFFVYNQSVGPKVDALLRHYQQMGLVTVLRWPPFPTDRSWYHSQNAAINDCVYRNRGISKFVVVIDTDEYLIPVRHTSWEELLEAVIHKEAKENQVRRAASFTLRHSFYCYGENDTPHEPEWTWFKNNLTITKEEETFILRNDVLLFQGMFKKELLDAPRRCKTIYRPEFSKQAGIHYPHKMWSNRSRSSVVVDDSIGFVAHLRWFSKKCPQRTSLYRFYRDYLHTLRKYFDDFQLHLLSLQRGRENVRAVNQTYSILSFL
ncbi:uncharacterized protein LOC106011943 [Aplysia californica]|uniref:Glycosyltransferase family 92 protein n=1 Tax=Aplysia californica TaxID=6500 RepID=A0ABM1A152_APLCA|nr:uncharacterized protein LOC106011943 [Aplysia californica]